jgi:site-specific recombinase XerD
MTKDKKHQNQEQTLVLQGNAYDNFINALKTEATAYLYNYALKKFMAFKHVQHVNDLLPSSPGQIPDIQYDVIRWIVHLTKVEHLAPVSVSGSFSAIKKFYEMNDVILNNRKISSYLPRDRKINNDRPYTREEIAKLLTFCGPRERALVLLLASTGMRAGAASELQIQHLHKIKQYGLYKITVYQGDPHEYYCFCTPEAAQAIDMYLQYRQDHFEGNVWETPEAPLIREEFDINDEFMARHPRKMLAEAIGDIISYKLQRANIVPLSPMKEGQKKGQKRHHIARSHGFRKFVNSCFFSFCCCYC